MHTNRKNSGFGQIRAIVFVLLAACVVFCGAELIAGQTKPSTSSSIAVGAQYDSTHVYVAPGDMDAFVASFIATFGGRASNPVVTNVLPVPSSAEFRYVWTPAGTLSVFAFHTPIPYPFGQERTGYLVTDMSRAVSEARSAGAEILVEPFKDPIGMDTVIQWPGGVKMQLYWHFTAPSYPALETIPDNRVYVSKDVADTFVSGFLRFSSGSMISDDKDADGREIGRAGETYRRIRITSLFGNMQVNVTDGHLPYPFGREVMGYRVQDLAGTLAKAKAAGAKILSAPYAAKDRDTSVVEFPGGYIAEIHGEKPR
jgi:predicted enzyme related to lactoylglutathione lyase